MGESRHTPGPWTVDGPPWNQIVWSNAENRVCFLAHSNGLDDNRDIATGHLIAAAPDLLEMAKWAEAAIAPFSKEPAEKSGISRLRAAIAKAEGRS